MDVSTKLTLCGLRLVCLETALPCVPCRQGRRQCSALSCCCKEPRPSIGFVVGTWFAKHVSEHGLPEAFEDRTPSESRLVSRLAMPLQEARKLKRSPRASGSPRFFDCCGRRVHGHSSPYSKGRTGRAVPRQSRAPADLRPGRSRPSPSNGRHASSTRCPCSELHILTCLHFPLEVQPPARSCSAS